MQTKLSAFCDKVIEAGWLVVIIVVPLFFNVYSARVFEPDKLTLLRSIVLVISTAWLIKLIEQGLRRPEEQENETPPGFWIQARSWITRTPLVLPTLLLVIVYILSTITSITPRISLLGSYQRLQGTYTTLSYIVVFFLMLQNLRTREQINRLVTTAILTSIPISLYGIIQHYDLDPLPWQGDVITRVAGNMGNSIFVAAYLIMVVPLTLARIVDTFTAILKEEQSTIADVILGACYIFTCAIQVICIFFTASRGPWLGLFAGLFFFILTLGVTKRKRWVAWAVIALAVVVGIFLIALNLPNTPLEPLKELPYVGRLGTLLETESGTGKVRVLIWEGNVQLLSPHPPLEFPDGQPDRLHFLRPFLGYGPESMWVAYNRFYPPDLAHVEARNASPDRSHNETFDALVITGVFGFLAEMFLLASVFYHGFRWLGLIGDRLQRNIFIGLWIGGGIFGAMFFGLWQGPEFIGVGLPFGIALGLGAYLVAHAVFFYHRGGTRIGGAYETLLIGLVAAMMAHFVEIHFGIAIAATRTYFWVYAGLMVTIAYALKPELIPSSTSTPETVQKQRRKRRKKHAQPAPAAPPTGAENWLWPVMSYALPLAIILATLGYDFTTNQQGLSSAMSIIGASLTVRLRGGQLFRSPAMLFLFLITLALGTAIVLAELSKWKTFAHERTAWWKAAVITVDLAAGLWFIVAFVLASRLATVTFQTELIKLNNLVASILPLYYLLLLGLLLLLAFVLTRREPVTGPVARMSNLWLYPPLVIAAIYLIVSTNLNVIVADIYFKQAEPYHDRQLWDASIISHQQAIRLAPKEDYYYLFLGAAFLEKAKSVPVYQSVWPYPLTVEKVINLAPSELAQLGKSDLLECARLVLERARQLNPLNTDHSANLGRLYRTWAELVPDPQQRTEKIRAALQYYEQATSLSPHNAQLWDEWGLVYLIAGDYQAAIEKYQHSLTLDAEFAQTYLSLGDAYMAIQQLDLAAESYEKALALEPDIVQAHSVLGYIYAQQGRIEDAIQENLAVVQLSPQDYNSHKNLALLYQQQGRLDEALAEAQVALSLAPESEKAAVQSLIAQLQATGGVGEAEALIQSYLSEGEFYLSQSQWVLAEQAFLKVLALNPNHVVAHSALGYAYAMQGRTQEAITENLAVVALSPNDYDSHKNLSILYQSVGQYDEALQQAQIALSLAPEADKPALQAFIAQLEQQKKGASGG
ncbi:MAG: tetratricopeptide repeat protein [Anaerolineae bacterium]|jgi:tetratricopeptide (TPR) repeat protein/O-antigen ligase|nr:tetratricopeptide repeat protein [Anaerolineae bacterium]MDH7474910.1 tetratricopeptide repeat protein [Anaerolineae bacterium]